MRRIARHVSVCRAADVVRDARRIADELLFPAALETDARDRIPAGNLDALADGGLYGLSGPAEAGGVDADFETACTVTEILSGGCLSTAFVWAQHLGAVIAAAQSDTVRDAWLEPLCRGRRRAGLALGGVLPGPPVLTARETDEGWLLDGTSSWVSGWGLVDVVHTAARTGDDRVVWSLVDARESGTLTVEPLRLVAVNATATVRASFRSQLVPHDRVTSVVGSEEWQAPTRANVRTGPPRRARTTRGA